VLRPGRRALQQGPEHWRVRSDRDLPEHLTDADAEHLTHADAEHLTDAHGEHLTDAYGEHLTDAHGEHLSSASGCSDAEPVTECASAGHD